MVRQKGDSVRVRGQNNTQYGEEMAIEAGSGVNNSVDRVVGEGKRRRVRLVYINSEQR